MSDYKQLWGNCLQEIELSVSRANFSTWLINKYHKLILKTFRGFQDEIRGVEYVITKYEPKKTEVVEDRGFLNKKLPLGDLYINKDDNLNPRYVFDSFVVGSFNQLAHAAAQAIIARPGMAYNPFFVYGGTGF